MGGGKSHWIRANHVYYHLHHAAKGIYGIRTLVTTDTFRNLRDRFHSHFNREWGMLGKVVQNHGEYGYAFVFHDHRLGAICMRSLHRDIDEFRGKEFGMHSVDELSVLPKHFKGEFILHLLRTPLRSSLGVDCLPLCAASNWDGAGMGWMREAWWDRKDFQQLNPDDFFYLHATIFDNANREVVRQKLPDILAYTGALRESRLHGRPTMPTGAMFSAYGAHVKFRFRDRFPYGIPAGYPIFIGIDWGIGNPFAVLWTCVDEEGDFWTFREAYAADLTTQKQCQMIQAMTLTGERIQALYYDPSMAEERRDVHSGQRNRSVIDVYQELLGQDPKFGPLIPGLRRPRLTGFRLLNDMMDYEAPARSAPRWHVEADRCPNLIGEIEGAVRAVIGGHFSEDLNDSCSDHALTAGYYHLLRMRAIPNLRGATIADVNRAISRGDARKNSPQADAQKRLEDLLTSRTSVNLNRI